MTGSQAVMPSSGRRRVASRAVRPSTAARFRIMVNLAAFYDGPEDKRLFIIQGVAAA